MISSRPSDRWMKNGCFTGFGLPRPLGGGTGSPAYHS